MDSMYCFSHSLLSLPAPLSALIDYDDDDDDDVDHPMVFTQAMAVVRRTYRTLDIVSVPEHKLLHDTELVSAMTNAQRKHLWRQLRHYKDTVCDFKENATRLQFAHALFAVNYKNAREKRVTEK